MKVLVTGGGGFIGSHVAERYAKEGHEVTILDNLSRAQLLQKEIKNAEFNIRYLQQLGNVAWLKEDVCNAPAVEAAAKHADVIFHAAAQTAVTTSVTAPLPDFRSNALGTFTVLEAARKASTSPAVIYCSTNKVFGNNVNGVGVTESESRYGFEEKFAKGIPETFPIDHCEHTPYGVSKLTGDLYVQDYAHVYGLKTGVFRMSCIYGTRQFGVEDQGWVAWFTIATLLGKPLTIYGDGKQVRDVLFVSDLVELYDRFLKSKLKSGVFNTGGGSKNTLSLLELLDVLEQATGRRSTVSYAGWRPSDQKVFIADISKAQEQLGWQPQVSPQEGVRMLAEWVAAHKELF